MTTIAITKLINDPQLRLNHSNSFLCCKFEIPFVGLLRNRLSVRCLLLFCAKMSYSTRLMSMCDISASDVMLDSLDGNVFAYTHFYLHTLLAFLLSKNKNEKPFPAFPTYNLSTHIHTHDSPLCLAFDFSPVRVSHIWGMMARRFFSFFCTMLEK